MSKEKGNRSKKGTKAARKPASPKVRDLQVRKGGAEVRGGAGVSHQDIHFTHPIDKSSPL